MGKRGRPKKKPEEISTTDVSIKESSQLQLTLNALEKALGKGIIAKADSIVDLEKVPTNIFLIDVLLKGGLPKGTINIFYGMPSSGKSLATILTAKYFTDKKIMVTLIDTEKAFEKTWWIKNGVDLKYLYVAQPNKFETAIDLADTLVGSRAFGLVILDSLTASVPEEEGDKSATEQQMALQARLNSKLMKKITSRLQPLNLTDATTYNDTIFIGVCHIREKVGMVFGTPRILAGGWAIKLHAHTILYFSTRKAIAKQNEDPTGQELRIKVEKSKCSPPLVSGVMDFNFNPPKINNTKVLFTYGIQYGILKKEAGWYNYGDIKAHGANALVEELKKNPAKLKELKEDVINYEN